MAKGSLGTSGRHSAGQGAELFHLLCLRLHPGTELCRPAQVEAVRPQQCKYSSMNDDRYSALLLNQQAPQTSFQYLFNKITVKQVPHIRIRKRRELGTYIKPSL